MLHAIILATSKYLFTACAQLREFKGSGQPTSTDTPSNTLEGTEIKTLLHHRRQIVELSCVEAPGPIHMGAAASQSLQVPPSHPQPCPAWPQTQGHPFNSYVCTSPAAAVIFFPSLIRRLLIIEQNIQSKVRMLLDDEI